MTVGVYALTDAGVMALLHRARSFDLAATRAALRAAIERERLPAARLRVTAPYDDDCVFISIAVSGFSGRLCGFW